MDEKTLRVFGDKSVVVHKALVDVTRDEYRQLPKFVLDFLVSSFVAVDNPGPGLRKINKFLSEHYVDSSQKELLKYRLEQRGEYILFGKIQVRVDQSKGACVYWVDMPSLGDDKVRINPEILEEYGQALLVDGCWGKIHLIYDPSVAVSRSRIAPYLIVDFCPMQVVATDVNEWINSRNNFSTEEWTDLLISTIGFDPQVVDEYTKEILLCRLVPFIENAVNLIELGARETGKTYAYRNLSDRGYVVSGSNITSAVLFYHKVKRLPGVIVSKDVVCFDEIADSEWNGDGDIINVLKDVMNSGSFSRDIEFTTNAGVCFTGNISTNVETKEVAGYHKHLFYGLPSQIRDDSAFLDRIHGFIPGWKMSKLQSNMYAKGYGFLADYFSSIMYQMRDRNYSNIVNEHIKLTGSTTRSEIAIRRITSGLLKLVFPHRDETSIQKNELQWALDIAISLRQRIIDQLAVIEPKEFCNVNLGYEWKKEQAHAMV
jgi:ATP-dependent Lon protease